jgi:hypothetical protein
VLGLPGKAALPGALASAQIVEQQNPAIGPGFVENQQLADLVGLLARSARMLALSARPAGLSRYSAWRQTETV